MAPPLLILTPLVWFFENVRTILPFFVLIYALIYTPNPRLTRSSFSQPPLIQMFVEAGVNSEYGTNKADECEFFWTPFLLEHRPLSHFQSQPL